MSVLRNVAIAPMKIGGLARADAEERARTLLRRVGLAEKAGAYPDQLSGGQQQRVAIARALVTEPALILADEPTGNLDSANGAMILELIQSIHKSLRPTIVMATHSERAASFGDYIIEVSDGRVRRA